MIVTVELYSMQVSIQYLAMILVGGLGSVFGAILGAIFITLLPVALGYMVEFLTIFLPDAHAILSSFRQFVFGLVIILFLIFEPGGLVHIWNNIKNYFRLWPFSY